MWKNIKLNIQNIEYDTGKATLIKMPNNSNYKGYKFWHPSKLIRSGANSYAVSMGYTDEFVFKLFKTGNGKHNKYDVVNEIEIDVEEFEKAFETMCDSVRNKDNHTYLIVEEPTKIDIEVEIEESLKNE